MKRLLYLVLLLPAFALGQSAYGPYGVFGGPVLSTSLPPATNVPINTYAFTTDQGLLVDNGSQWVSATSISGSGFGAITSGDNTTAAMTVDTGATLATANGGVITASTAASLANAPTQCTSGQFATGIATTGNANCSTPTGSGNLSSSGTPSSGQLSTFASSSTIGGTTVGSNTMVGNSGSGIAALTPANAIGVLDSGTANAQTASYALVLSDANSEVTLNSSSATALTIPANATVNFPVGTLETLQALGTGAVSVTLAGGVSVQYPGPLVPTASLGGQYGFAQFQQVSTNNWNTIAYAPGNTKFTVSGGTCSAAASTAGGATGGTITLAASGTVNSCTLIVTPGAGLTTQNLWVGRMCDRNQLAVPCWGESSSSTTTITFTIPAATAASDVLTFKADPE